MRRAISAIMVLAVVVSGLFIGAAPAAAQGNDGINVFLPQLGDNSVPGLSSLTVAVEPDEAGQDSALVTPFHMPAGTFWKDAVCDAEVFGGRYMEGISIVADLSFFGEHANANMSVDITRPAGNVSFYPLFFDWTLLDILPGYGVGAVVVETGQGASAFEYDAPYPLADQGLHAPGFYHIQGDQSKFFNRKIRKVTFCILEGSEGNPALDLEKFTGFVAEAAGGSLAPQFFTDADTPEEAIEVSPNSVVVWRYTATNTGDVPLFVTIVDDIEGDMDICFPYIVDWEDPSSYPPESAVTLPYELAPGAVVDCAACTGSAPNCEVVGGETDGRIYSNLGTATGTLDSPDGPVGAQDTDPSHYTVTLEG